MQPTELTLPGILLFVLTVIVIFAFKNPRGYKKIQNTLVIIVTITYGAVLGINLYKDYLLSKFNGEVVGSSTVNYLFSYAGDFVFYSAAAFLLYTGIILLERLHTLKDKN